MDKVKKWIRNLSVRKTIILYLSVSLLVCFLLSAFIGNAASDIQEYIWEKYTDEEDFETVLEIENQGYLAQIPRPAASEMSRLDHTISEICDFLQTYAVLILPVCTGRRGNLPWRPGSDPGSPGKSSVKCTALCQR